MGNWIIVADEKMYDVDSSFAENKLVDWKQCYPSRCYKYNVEDIVYIYCKHAKKVKYKTVVKKTYIPFSECIDDKKFWKDPKDYEDLKERKFARLKLLEKLEIDELSYDNLRENGLRGGIRGPKKLEGNLLDYIEKWCSPSINKVSANIIRDYLDKHELGDFEQESYEEAIKSFYDKFSPKILEELEGVDLINKIFIHDGDKTTLCHNLEYTDEYKRFGSIRGGSSFKYFLYKEKDFGWRKGPSIKPTIIAEDEAIQIGTKIRDAIVNGANFIENAKLETIEDYKLLESELNKIFEDCPVNPTSSWIHKYYVLIFPDKFPIWHNEDGKEQMLEKFNISPEDEFYAKDGQLYLLSKEASIKFYSLFDKRIIELFDEFSSNLKRNVIYFGAPGTGKSFELNTDKDDLIEDEKDYERVTFHPDYSYANFVGTYKPVPKGEDSISYEYVPGPFMRSLVKALLNPQKPFLLIIEEINRSNVAAVFGDVFQLLDRDENYESKFPIETSEEMRTHLESKLKEAIKNDENLEKYLKSILDDDFSRIKIPSNMFIWATMNSADQGVFPMDTAFKRRWDFKYFGINNNQERIEHIKVNLNNQEISWNDLRKAINKEALKYGINEDKLLGPFFAYNEYVDEDITDEEFKEIFKNKVIMYLFEDGVKPKRKDLFAGAKEDNNVIYSRVCELFDNIGIEIFSEDIQKELLNPNTEVELIDSDLEEDEFI